MDEPEAGNGGLIRSRRVRVLIGLLALAAAAVLFGGGCNCNSLGSAKPNPCESGNSDDSDDSDVYLHEFSLRPLSLADRDGEDTSTYGPMQSLGGDEATRAIAVADLNGDGFDDVVLANEGEANAVYFGDPSGPPKRVALGSVADDSVAVGVGDLDGDGNVDIVVGNNGQPNRWYRNAGGVTPFGPSSTAIDIGSESHATAAVVVEDFNGDERLDVFVAGVGPSGVYLGQEGATPFDASSTQQVLGSWPTRALAAADFDGDGDLDIALGNEFQANRWYANSGLPARPFGDAGSEHQIGGVDWATFALAVGDFDDDGRPDVVTANAEQGARWYANSSDGFADDDSGTLIGEAQGLVYKVVAFDQDFDGVDDVLVNNSVNGNRWFAAAKGPGIPVGTASQGTWTSAVGDVDGDRALDIITGDPIKDNAWYPGALQKSETVVSESITEFDETVGQTFNLEVGLESVGNDRSGADYSLSNDGGESWRQVMTTAESADGLLIGGQVTFPNEGNDLRWQVELWHAGGDDYLKIGSIKVFEPDQPDPEPEEPVKVTGMLGAVPGASRMFGVLGGDPDGSGSFDITLDPNTAVVCFTLNVENLDSPTVAELIGPDGNTVAIDLRETGLDQCWTALPDVTRGLPTLPVELLTVADAYLSAPEQSGGGSGFSLEIATEEFPEGAIRGDLPVAPVPVPAAGGVDPGVPLAVCLGHTVTVNLAFGQVPTDSDDVIQGTPGDDLIAAGDGDDLICGLGGNDTIWGQGGNDEIFGHDGDDKIRGGAGNDALYGGNGADDLNGGSGDDRVFGDDGDDPSVRGGTGDDFVDGGDGNDGLINGNGGQDMVFGGAGDDPKVNGGPRPDRVDGGPGNDGIKGNKGADTLLGGDGDDDIRGGPQPDAIDGGAGTDTCNGGTTGEGAPETDTAQNCTTVTQVP